MELTAEEAMRYAQDNIAEMTTLSASTGNRIVVCPSFPIIKEVCSLTADTPVCVGGQTCSSFASGAYTGEVPASLLAELGCRYCIVGHSERRRYCHETDDDCARKVRLCLLDGIAPILCIGETNNAEDVSATVAILDEQLGLLHDYLLDLDPEQSKPLWIAYEPVWAIGTGRIPEHGYLIQVYDAILSIVARRVPKGFTVNYMYGGSLTESNIQSILHIEAIDGFLVGLTSLDFQKFKNMISLCA
jgi:Triosephosphate isomerase